MKVCLAAPSSRKKEVLGTNDCRYWLESFYSMTDWLMPVMKKADLFMLDSGAYSFMTGTKVNISWEKYVGDYSEFINRNGIDHFFELDIDGIVGLNGVEKLRDLLERETGKQPIPVWHKSRGKEYFIEMCDRYKYVAIGGIVTHEITPSEYKYFHWFIDTAHKHGCKIHGLGFTNTVLLHEYNFDSVDSTAWCRGSRFGEIMMFDGRQMVSYGKDKRRLPNTSNAINKICFEEWIKFQKYAENNL